MRYAVNWPEITNVTDFKEQLSNEYTATMCDHCSKLTLWHNKAIIFPRQVITPPANDDLGDDIKKLYAEAALILQDSPRSAAALLRLGLQLLLKDLGGKGKNINDDIAALVKAGVSPQAQKAMDILRVFGNNGAHPGEINLEEDKDTVAAMFGLINFVADKMISQQKEIEGLYEGLPSSVKEQITKRDEPKADENE